MNSITTTGHGKTAGAAAVAAAAWLGLALQFYVSAGLMRANGHGWLHIVVRYFSYFTVLTNTLVALTTTLPLVVRESGAGRFFALPWVRAAVADYIAVVGIAYSLLLRHVWSPKGLALVADSVLHDVVPVLYVAFWVWLEPKGSLRRRDLPRWLIYPLAYVVVTMVRGAQTGFYPYPFIDAGELGYTGAFAGIAQLFVAFTVIGLTLFGIDHSMGRSRKRSGTTAVA